MLIQRISPIDRKQHAMQIDVTPFQLHDWSQGTSIQNAMPNLTPDEREFIRIGITPEQSEELYKDMD
jgi:hypothetical protein